MNMKDMNNFLLLLPIFLPVLVSCGTAGKSVKAEPFEYIQSEKPAADAEGPESTGSLWRDNEGLFSDKRAKNVNDIVTVRVVESSKASRSAKTTTGRKSELEGGIDALFGLEGGFGKHKFDPSSMIGLSADKSFSGTGATERSGNLTGTITALVKEVYPNGMMRIEGKRIVTVNEEDQYITLKGLIRRDDIAVNNTILSTKVADAVIKYSGEGIIGREQKPGWLTNALDAVWPF